MLIAYFDETGHSKDQRTRFNGMAGLIAPEDHWEAFENKWKATLNQFDLPFFHMTDFANFAGPLLGWSEAKRQRLFAKLMRHIENVFPMPIGTSLPMNSFREMPENHQQMFGDPYLLGFLNVITQSSIFLKYMKDDLGAGESVKIALVFSDQVEFRHDASKLYEDAVDLLKDTVAMKDVAVKLRNTTLSPVFRDMRELLPLQAADIIAYEVYKEHERRLYRPQMTERFGYLKMIEMANRLEFKGPLCTYHTPGDLIEFVAIMEKEERRKAYWKKQKEKKAATS